MKHKLQATHYNNLVDYIACKWRYKLAVIDGLEGTPEYQPEMIKLGNVWRKFNHSLHNKEHDFTAEIQPFHLSPMQIAKISALTRAHADLEIQSKGDGLLGCHYQIYVPVGQEQVILHVDRAYEKRIVETKLSTRPDFFRHRENLAYKLSTAFMGNDSWEYADVEIVRMPSLRQKPDESAESYEERCYGDIVGRPAHYFIGWDRRTRTYGVRFWRSEFDLDEIFRTYVWVFREMKETLARGSWYPNTLACYVPVPCPFLPIRKSGVISPEIYTREEVKI